MTTRCTPEQLANCRSPEVKPTCCGTAETGEAVEVTAGARRRPCGHLRLLR
ncbi:hypothetical protein LDL08_20170 [Nonomuraea glycinis]|uniref:Uncharacterized protein n=1 Tax=Nonomuraea glycinis TaxID=2047744 RepID=A0A918E862_9ACTN|nr:hypothetical protein [Nonomuraea glycinis]MCA2178508.1 hypothetical protein [Nonomuraea glycinis]GGP14073.1 hypothetical protein GCM10012278_68400 [Nonomuraea glycinis]